MGQLGSRPASTSSLQGQQRQGAKEPPAALANWTEAQLLRLIGEKKLAPRFALTSSVERETECPICFCEYEYLNLVSCCQQLVCTNCYIKLRKPLDSNCMCCFCEKKGFLVTFSAGAGDMPQQDGPGISSSPASSSSTPYRSRTATPVHIPLSSKADRKVLEREISLSRSYVTHDSGRYYGGGGERGRSNSEQVVHRASNDRRPLPSQQEALRELSRLLGGGDTGEVERLEDFMMMAAIRQSMQEAPTSTSHSAAAGGVGGEKVGLPPLPPPASSDMSSQEGGRESADSLDEEEQMLLAITLSLGVEPSASDPSGR